MRYCNHCGGEFRMEYVSKYPHKKYREVSDKYYDDSSDENSDLRTLIKKHNLKGVSLRYNEESHHWHISKVITYEDWVNRYKEFMSHEELNDENKKKYREKLKKHFLRIFVCSNCGFSTPDKTGKMKRD
ncbi:hypothetical protein LCGC14_1236180 [marine sediment metagenome]|uniref:Uncharacterized protein n=1 Tax=marine sediment metagenome TaxID=412755 RepID=A0A0F9PBC5_9ZZZZ